MNRISAESLRPTLSLLISLSILMKEYRSCNFKISMLDNLFFLVQITSMVCRCMLWNNNLISSKMIISFCALTGKHIWHSGFSQPAWCLPLSWCVSSVWSERTIKVACDFGIHHSHLSVGTKQNLFYFLGNASEKSREVTSTENLTSSTIALRISDIWRNGIPEVVIARNWFKSALPSVLGTSSTKW